ncbi:MAG: hypothetical protein PHR83_18675 [Paludibacter sp.]|nr:hypothetical protein [Paludibacter sp.]
MEYKTILVIIGVIMIALLLKSCVSKNNSKNENRPITKDLPQDKIENDKVVLIENVNLDEVKNAIQQFCNSYNQEDFKALPLLSVISEKKFIVTFPYDIEFEIYCYFVNYLYYPNDITYKPIIKAWTTTKPSDMWMKDDIVNKKVMLYIPSDDKEYDNVYLTTSDNFEYKMGFALGESSKKLNESKQTYSEPVKLDELKLQETIQFK